MYICNIYINVYTGVQNLIHNNKKYILIYSFIFPLQTYQCKQNYISTSCTLFLFKKCFYWLINHSSIVFMPQVLLILSLVPISNNHICCLPVRVLTKVSSLCSLLLTKGTRVQGVFALDSEVYIPICVSHHITRNNSSEGCFSAALGRWIISELFPSSVLVISEPLGCFHLVCEDCVYVLLIPFSWNKL